MEGEDKEKYLEFVRQNVSFIILAGAGVLFLLIGVGLLISEKSRPPEMTISSVATQSASVGSLKADIEGAVLKPGVYELVSGARVQDLLVAAGGLLGVADRDYVSKNINLAMKLTDGAKIYIPKKGEPATAKVPEGQAIIININNASESELDKLYGVGAVTAQKIIAGRPYSKIEDLVSKKVLGQNAFDKIKDNITVY